jgi:MerR family transcriptional regulator, light-induced transcriptional regulator
MATTLRGIQFDPALLAELEERTRGEDAELSRMVNAAVDRFLHGGRPVPSPDGVEGAADALREALVAGDARAAHRVVAGVLARGARVLDVHCDVVAPALHEVGHLWAVDDISIAQEHRASEIAAQLLATMAPDRRLPPTAGRLAIVSGSPDEQHVLGSRMVADLLERAGWEVVALGASTPASELLDLARSECPDLVALSTSTAGRLPGVQEVLRGLAALDPRPFIAVGGPVYAGETAGFALDLGADVVTRDLRELLDVVRLRFPPVPMTP